MRILVLASLFLFASIATAQTNVRGWYAKGQVWIVWQTPAQVPMSYGIYKSRSPFTNTSGALRAGRLFPTEYFPYTFKEQVHDSTFQYTIPGPGGSPYTLKANEALFVDTPTSTDSAYYAVVEWGATAATPGVNRTQTRISWVYDPVNDPVTCHLQLSTPLITGHQSRWYCLWLLGNDAHWSGRPDFPVMASSYKNGMPAMFIVSEALAMDTLGGKRVPATNWFHGGGGVAVNHTADKTEWFNIAPALGVSISHTDDMSFLLVKDGDTLLTSGRTLWLGWTNRHDPFDPTFNAGPGDTVINYTQRRILWINNWMVRHHRVDPDRIALQGYSMGSAGASALGKAYPEYFSTVCAFNCGYRSVTDSGSQSVFGTLEENLPTSLRGPGGVVIRMNEAFDLTTRTSPTRDLPLFRTWAGKTDPNERMHWGPDLVAQYRRADSLGYGTQISWDERPHTYETVVFHWIQGPQASEQTYRDNLAFQELSSRNVSYPAFFNHRLDPRNNDPGTGIFGINTGDGDNWGTWGGWHTWDPQAVIDEADHWEVTAWLMAGAPFANDNCPHDSLRADLSLRRTQRFKPAVGTTVRWWTATATGGDTLQRGTATVAPDGLVSLTGVKVYRNPKRVKIHVGVGTPTDVAADGEGIVPGDFVLVGNYPNPFNPSTTIRYGLPQQSRVTLTVYTLLGQEVAVLRDGIEDAGYHEAVFDARGLSSGMYILRLNADRRAALMSKLVLAK